jgi:integrase
VGNPQNRELRIPAALMKGRRPLSLPIVSGLFDIPSAWRARGIETSGYVFPSPQHGKHVTELRLDFQYIAKATGIDVSAHDLRRTFARACKRSGVGKWQAAELLSHAGHSQPTTTPGKVTPTTCAIRCNASLTISCGSAAGTS